MVKGQSEPSTAPTKVRLTKTAGAALRLRVLPWRVRARRLRSSVIRDNADSVLELPDDLGSLVLSLGIWIILVIAAPVVAFVLSIVLLPFEATLVAIIAAALLLVRFAGLTSWTVVLTDTSGQETIEKFRSVVGAVRRVRSVNDSRGVAVQLIWR